jgi:hypothetical protein
VFGAEFSLPAAVLTDWQMSLDTKRAEIQKLEERARQRDEALKKSEVGSIYISTISYPSSSQNLASG